MKKIILISIAIFVSFVCILIYQDITYNDKRLHLVFCDVGQGDAIFIRTPGGSDILIDGGPDDSVLNCLGKHMPFLDRDLELVILTHPHGDHLNGLWGVFKNYKVKLFATEKLGNNTQGYKYLLDLINEQKVRTQYVYAGDKFKLKDGVEFQIVGPTKKFLESTSPEGTIGESSEFGSVETLLNFGNFSALLTGDSQASELSEALSDPELVEGESKGNISILQIPHHGSKTGLTSDLLDRLNPSLAIISVGAKNKYGHPTPFILDLLKTNNIKTLRTDQNGEVEIVSDGIIFSVKK